MKKKLNSIDENLTDQVQYKDHNSVDDEDNLDTGDCEVFECSVVSLGHTAYSLYDRVSQLSERISGL